MRNTYLAILSTVLSLFIVSCEPMDDRDSIGGAITAAQLDVSATPIMVNGKNSNKIALKNNSPVLPWWNYGLGTSQKTVDTVTMVVTGTHTITFTGLNPDGSKISKDLEVTVDDLTFAVPPQWGYLCGTGEKKWTWDESTACFGNGGYLISTAPAWWQVNAGDMDAQSAGEGKGAYMVFSTNAAAFTKHLTDGTSRTGTLSFDMSDVTLDTSGNTWAIGKLKFTGTTALCGLALYGDNGNISSFDILALNDNTLVLAYSTDKSEWATCLYWVFRPVE